VAGGVILAAAAGLGSSTQALVVNDQVRGANEQNLRSLLEFVGREVRDAGHLMSVPTTFVEIVNGKDASGRDADTLIVRRGLVDAPGVLCRPIEGNSERHVTIAIRGDIGTNPAECASAGDIDGDGFDDFLGLWRTFRLQNGVTDANGNRALTVLLYEASTGRRELFPYLHENDNDPTLAFVRLTTQKRWRHQYFPSFTNPITLNVIEERRFFMVNGDLQMVLNEGAPQTVATGVESFSVTARLTDGVVRTDYDNTLKGVAALEGIQVSIRGTARMRGQVSSRVMSDTFSPRNTRK
jgi:hypothetical protein